MKEFKYEIKKHIGTVSGSPDGKYTTEVNYISFNDAPKKIDIRKWNKETGQMLKGISMTESEAETLVQILLGMKEENE